MGRRGLLAGLAALSALAAEAKTLTFEGLCKSFGVLGFQFSDRAVALRGEPVRMIGYMVPPLKPESRFFVRVFGSLSSWAGGSWLSGRRFPSGRRSPPLRGMPRRSR